MEHEEPPDDPYTLEPNTVECMVCGRHVPNYARSLRDHADEHTKEPDQSSETGGRPGAIRRA